MFDLAGIGFPLWILLALYGAYLVFFVTYSAFNMYHLLRFGTEGIGLYAVMAVFLGGTALLLAGSYAALSPVDWTAAASLSDYGGRALDAKFFPGF